MFSRPSRLFGALAAWLCFASCTPSPPPSWVGKAFPTLSRPGDSQAPLIDIPVGRTVLIDIWATWCGPCERSLPTYADWQQRYAGQGLVVFAINVDHKADTVASFLASHIVPSNIIRDPDGLATQKLGLTVLPTVFLIDRHRVVRHVMVNYSPEDKDQLQRQLEAVLAEASEDHP